MLLKKGFIEFVWNLFGVCFGFYWLGRGCDKKEEGNVKKEFGKNGEEKLRRG